MIKLTQIMLKQFIHILLMLNCTFPAFANNALPPLVPAGESLKDFPNWIIENTANYKNAIFSPDGRMLASISENQTIKLWDIKRKALIYTFGNSSKPVYSIAFSPDGNTLAFGSSGDTIQLWDINKKKLRHTFQGDLKTVFSIAFSPDGKTLASGSSGDALAPGTVGVKTPPEWPTGYLIHESSVNNIRIWDVNSKKLIHIFEGHPRSVKSIAFSPDGNTLASGSTDSTVRLWDINKKILVHTFEGHSSSVNSLVFNPDGNTLASIAPDLYDLRIWDINKKSLIRSIEGISFIAFSPDGKTMASVSSGLKIGQKKSNWPSPVSQENDNTAIKLWDTTSSKIIHSFEGQPSFVSTLAFSPDGNTLASASWDKKVRLWDIQSDTLIYTFEGYSPQVTSIAISPDGKTLASSSGDNIVRLWNMASNTLLHTFEGHNSTVNSVAFSPNGKMLASGSSDNTIKLWDPHTKILIQTFKEKSRVMHVTFSPDSKKLVSEKAYSDIWLWDIDKNTSTRIYKDSKSVAFSPDGRLIAFTNRNNIRILDIESGTIIRSFQNNKNNNRDLVNFVIFSPDSNQLAVSSPYRMRLWDIKNKVLINTFKLNYFSRMGNQKQIKTASFSPDGSILAFSTGYKKIMLWDIHKNKLIKVFSGHSSLVTSLAFTPDGNTLVSASLDRTIKLWDIRNQKWRNTLIGGLYGSWISLDSVGNFLRADKKGELFLTYKNQHYSSAIPTSFASSQNLIEVAVSQDITQPRIEFNIGESKNITLSIYNKSNKNILWVKPVLEKNTSFIIAQTPVIYQLHAGETKSMQVKISPRLRLTESNFSKITKHKFLKSIIEPYEADLTINVVAPEQTQSSITIPVKVNTPQIKVASANILDSGGSRVLNLTIENYGTHSVENTVLNLKVAGINKFDSQTITATIPAKTTVERSFPIPKGFELTKETVAKLNIRTAGLPFFDWNLEQKITLPAPSWWMYLGLLLLTLLAATSVFYYRRYRHPLVLELSESPQSVVNLPIEQLAEAQQRLEQTSRLEKVLSDASVSASTLQTAASFHKLSTEEKAQIIASRLGAQSTAINENLSNAPAMALHQLKLNAGFPLNIDRALLCFPQKTAAEDVFTALKHQANTQSFITLIMGDASAYQRKLYSTTRDTSNKWVAPQGTEITRLLLAPDAEETLAEILSGQLSLQQISPYRIGGGVSNESVFFGRRELISQIINRDPANYLMAGGRQVGKSTLLKAIERRYADNLQVECVYFTLSSEVLVPRLASLLKLERTDDPEVLATQLDERIRESGQRYVFLVDESDRFIAQEKAHDYAILNVFRRLSEEGNCTFILAGFWQLYQHAVLDYQSPIRNFGELLSVGELEKSACIKLIMQPMKTMNLSYANEAIIKHIADSCGQRANLIAIVCQYIVRHLPPKQRVIEAGDVASALTSDDLRRALSGWVVGETDREQAYERLVVYGTISMDSFTTGELMALAEQQGVSVDTLELDRTLSRLELSFILGRKEGRWFYRVPLFVDYIREDSPELKLKAELRRITT